MSNCESCSKRPPEPVPYVVHEADMARQERTIKRLWILLLVMLVLLVGTNGAWIYYESQFVEESWTFEANTDDGGTAIANGDGEVYYYGEGKVTKRTRTRKGGSKTVKCNMCGGKGYITRK